ncbi:hypothetical protein V1512DRAFT_259565 [Lipomyces arxii]|uniref:uncharacterized protein n=1 Tax=Lipomyces arxii TaxID=56418 RepID=UPI0034CF5511
MATFPVLPSSSEEDIDRPRSILKNPPAPELYQIPAPPVDHDIVKQNTRVNAAQHSDHSNIRRRLSTATSSPGGGGADEDGESGARLKWDEANIYLTEQERTATMKITEPKTPYAHSVDMDLEDDEIDALDYSAEMTLNGVNGVKKMKEDVPSLDLGEPEETVPVPRFSSATIVSDEGERRISLDEQEGPVENLPEDEEEKHKRFEEMRKRHYEMKDALKLAHQLQVQHEDEDDDDDDDDDE